MRTAITQETQRNRKYIARNTGRLAAGTNPFNHEPDEIGNEVAHDHQPDIDDQQGHGSLPRPARGRDIPTRLCKSHNSGAPPMRAHSRAILVASAAATSAQLTASAASAPPRPAANT